jgi:hypothetical protein
MIFNTGNDFRFIRTPEVMRTLASITDAWFRKISTQI